MRSAKYTEWAKPGQSRFRARFVPRDQDDTGAIRASGSAATSRVKFGGRTVAVHHSRQKFLYLVGDSSV